MRLLLLAFFLTFTTITSLAQGSFCNTSGNIMLFTNYDGGTLNIDVNQNISNIKIGVVSYEAVTITISGTYSVNVTEVRYAGYNSNNTNCGSTISTTSISGASNATTSITFAPSSTLANSNGYGSIICGYSCNTNTSQGGCNTVDQIEDYWNSIFGSGALNFHRVQYGCWSGSQSISAGGDCCALLVPLSVTTSSTDESCFQACNGTVEATAGGGEPPYSYNWSSGATTATDSNLCPGEYYVTVTDDGSNTVIDTVTVDSAMEISTQQNVSLCNGETLQVGSSVYSSSGNYTDTLTSANGCDSLVNTSLIIEDAISTDQTFSAGSCEGFSVTIGNNTYTEAGVYLDTLTASNGCDSVVLTNIQIFQVTLINQQPQDKTRQAGQNAQFEVSVQSSATIQWQENDGLGFVNLSNAGIYSGTTDSMLQVNNVQQSMTNYLYRCVVNYQECSDTSDAATLTVKRPAGIDELTQNNFQFYPNPTADRVTLSWAGKTTAPAKISVQDFTGRTVLEHKCASSGGQTSFSVKELSSGNYFLIVLDETGDIITSLQLARD